MSLESVRDEVQAASPRDGRADWPGPGHFERRGDELLFSPAPDEVTELLDRRRRLLVPGFGAFVLHRHARYEGRHPVTKAPIVVEASEEVIFEPAFSHRRFASSR